MLGDHHHEPSEPDCYLLRQLRLQLWQLFASQRLYLSWPSSFFFVFRLMGCFHSIPSRIPATKEGDSSPSHIPATTDPGLELPVTSIVMHEISENAGDVGIIDFCEDYVAVKETDSEEILSVSVTSPDRYVRSDIAEDTTSRSGDSVDALCDTETPDPIVSPNPVSPSQEDNLPQTNIMDRFTKAEHTVYNVPIASSTPPGSIRFSSPVPVHSARKPVPLETSRLVEVSSLRNSRLCLQVFSVWRSDVLKTKVDNLQSNLEMAGKASEIILAENDQLKAKLMELENQMLALRSQSIPVPKPVEATAVQTDTNHELPVTPQKPLQDMNNFVTPPSARSQLMSSAYITPPEEPARRNWESVVSLSTTNNPPFPVRTSPIPLAVSQSPQSEKFRQLSNDIAKLTESIGKFELKKSASNKTPTTTAVTPLSYTYSP